MFEFLKWAGHSLEAMLLWRLLAWRAWRHYPILFCYFLILLARQGLITYMEKRYGFSSPVYSLSFWFSSSFTDIMKLLVAWEVFRKVFPPGSAAQRFAAALLLVTLAVLSVFYFLGGAHDTPFFVAVGLNFSFVVAVWIFGVLFLAQYYRIPLGGNVWGIALGLGFFSATAVVNFSSLGLNERAFPVFSYVRPASFVISIAIWTFCLWTYRPPPQQTQPASPADSAASGGPLELTAKAVGRALRQNDRRQDSQDI